MATIPQAVRNVKHYFATYVPETLIRDACAEAGHRWRERQLGPVARGVHGPAQQARWIPREQRAGWFPKQGPTICDW
jgi:hypothetical protein